MQSLGTHGGRLQKLRELIKKLMALTLITVLSVPAHASAAADPHGKYDGVLPDAYYDGMALCETNSDWSHSTKTYTGGLGFNRRSFQRWSNHSSAKGMTPRQQVRVADALAFRGHTEPSGEFVWPVGPWGWGCLKQRKSLQAFICKSRHKDVQRWKRNC